MELTEQRIRDMIAQGEGTALEFKTCRRRLNRDVYETVCAFLNRHGGRILLGVADDGEVTGIGGEAVKQVKQDFINAIGNPQTFTPFPKNPVIAAFFRQIGRADELGSGMRNLMKYGKSYGGANPEMIEGDVFRIIVKVPDGESPSDTQGIQGKGSEKSSGKGSEKSSEKILRLMGENTTMSAAEIADEIGLTSRAVEKQIAKLKANGRIRRVGPDKGGHWKVLK